MKTKSEERVLNHEDCEAEIPWYPPHERAEEMLQDKMFYACLLPHLYSKSLVVGLTRVTHLSHVQQGKSNCTRILNTSSTAENLNKHRQRIDCLMRREMQHPEYGVRGPL